MTATRILVVEDEQIVAEDLKMTLETLGYEVAGIASRGETAVELAESESPDLILMDIMLAGAMDGISAASEIRALFNIPVIYVTAYADSNLLERAKQTEPFGYIVKPFNEREVQSNIEIALFKHHMELELKKRDAILMALGFGMEWFLRQLSESHQITLRDEGGRGGYDFMPILEQIGVAMEIDRIALLRISPKGANRDMFVLVNEWTAPGIEPILGESGESTHSAEALGLSESIQELHGGTPASCSTGSDSEGQNIWSRYSIQTAFALPVFVSDQFWGTAIFCNRTERTYLDEEIEAMKIAANIVGGAMSLYISTEERHSPGADPVPG